MIRKYRLQLVLILIAIILISLGVIREEAFVVLGKSTRICLECIGIG
ncbi:MAG: hypothetical protein IJ836_07070 [Spirochaetales bacterium]|nr:hypothetical protein [Spirochaetales bacterium]